MLQGMKQAENMVLRSTGCLDSWEITQPESTVRFVCLREASVEKGVSLIDRVQRSFVESFFMHRSRIDLGGKHYVTTRDQQVADIHPPSFLKHIPEWHYHETVGRCHRVSGDVCQRGDATCGYQWRTWLLPG